MKIKNSLDKRGKIMFRKKLFKILSLSLSLSVASMGMAFAQSMDEPVLIQVTAMDEALYEKQAEIDKLLFETQVSELEKKGIMVTHTGAIEDYIEIGITPYTPENANYVSKLIGNEAAKVVEGTMAVTLQYNPELNDENVDPRVVMDPAELADDSQIVTITEDTLEEVEDISTTSAPDIEEDAKVVSAPVEKEKSISPLIIGAGAVTVLGAGAVLLKKKTA